MYVHARSCTYTYILEMEWNGITRNYAGNGMAWHLLEMANMLSNSTPTTVEFHAFLFSHTVYSISDMFRKVEVTR